MLYVAERLCEAGEASGKLRGRFLAENMLESGDHETFKQWLQTPPATPPEAVAEPAPRVGPRKPPEGLILSVSLLRTMFVESIPSGFLCCICDSSKPLAFQVLSMRNLFKV